MCWWKTTEGNIDAQFILEYMEDFSFQINKKTFVVLNNAHVHKVKTIKERIPICKKRTVHFLSSAIFSPSEHCRSCMEKTQERMAQSRGLPLQG